MDEKNKNIDQVDANENMKVDVNENIHEIADICLGKSSMEGIQKQISLANFENEFMRNELKI